MVQLERLPVVQRSVPVRSVPPRGSGWAGALPIANCRMPIGCLVKRQLAIGNRQLAMKRPTRYRVVVLTSLGPLVVLLVVLRARRQTASLRPAEMVASGCETQR